MLERLASAFSEPENRCQLDTTIDWEHYLERFQYNDIEGRLSLEDESPTDSAVQSA